MGEKKLNYLGTWAKERFLLDLIDSIDLQIMGAAYTIFGKQVPSHIVC